MDSLYSISAPSHIPERTNAKIVKSVGFITILVIFAGSVSIEATDVKYDSHFQYCEPSTSIVFQPNNLGNGNNLSFREFFTKTEGFTISYETKVSTEREYMLARLDRFINELNKENWDGYGAYPLERNSYDNAVQIIENTPEEVLKLWHIFPSPNGTISFEFKAREIAAMSVGNSDFSFVARRKTDHKVVRAKCEFDLHKATDALVVMCKHLGYL